MAAGPEGLEQFAKMLEQYEKAADENHITDILTQAGDALKRINEVLSAPTLPICDSPQIPADNTIEFEDVTFTYEGAEQPALDGVSFVVEPGQTVALVGPSGGGKTTAASLVPRFWDVDGGAVRVGGVDVRSIDPHELMDRVAFVFQNTHLFSTSVLENVRAARPDATREQVIEALHAAQCDDIIAKLPEGVDTRIGSDGTYLSGASSSAWPSRVPSSRMHPLWFLTRRLPLQTPKTRPSSKRRSPI